ncbi:MAG: TetR/AcrR family transcriptional regulator C-terminal domain-containing protein [Lachnospiraceae bacterium]|nr:TetR/AcrR family transcriptional regulator C-terminal domain-containing protein [Lachnospiraceae bacterium]
MAHRERTKRMLAQKLKEISLKVPLKSITVQMLASECDINRGTFYYHFRDMPDLINWIYHIEVTIPTHEFICSCDADFSGISKTVLQKIYASRDFYTQAIRLDGQNNLSDFMLEETISNWILLRDQFLTKRGLSFKGLSAPLQEDFNSALMYFCYGHFFASQQWMRDGMKTSPEHFACMLDIAAESGIFNLFRELLDSKAPFTL